MTTLWALTTNKDEFWLRMTLGASPKDGVLFIKSIFFFLSIVIYVSVPRSVDGVIAPSC